jgi:acetoin utilization deacetylase AcuC-like enzyme
MSDSGSETLRVYYRDEYVYDVLEAGPRHAFDIQRPRRVRDALNASGLADASRFVAAPPVSREQLLLVHSPDYLDSLRDASVLARLLLLDPAHPWDERLLEPFLYASGGTLAAAHAAVAEGGIGFNLGGGFHHAQADKAEGFCAIADVAIAIRSLRRADAARRVLIVDLDYHHGNGNAEIFAADESVFTFSIHANNWCWIDKRNNLDIELPPGTGDSAYLDAVRDHVPQILDTFKPDFVAYLAGADPFRYDVLGDFDLSESGMLARDRFITDTVRAAGLPLLIVTAGGYGPETWRVTLNYLAWLLAGRS